MATLSWNSPQTISGTGASDAHVVNDLSGNATAIWNESGIIKSSSLPFGGSWTAAVTLSNISNTASTPKLGVDSTGNVYATWLENAFVEYATLPFGGSWTAETAISSSGASSLTMAVDTSGNIVVGWIRSNLAEAITNVAGSGWGSVTTFSSSLHSANPKVAIGGGTGGTTSIVWYNLSGTSDQIMASTTTIGGTWGTPVNISTAAGTGHHFSFPRTAIDSSGNVIAIWFRYDIAGTHSDAIDVITIGSLLLVGASGWNTPVALSESTVRNPTDFISRCAFDVNGNAFALWTSSTTGTGFNVETNIRQPNGLLAGYNQIVSGNLLAYAADISIASTLVVVAYMFYDGTNAVIQTVETDIGGQTLNFYTPSTTVSTSDNNGYPSIATNLNGTTLNAIVVWTNSSGGSNTIQAATGSKTLLGSPSGINVTQSSTNFGLFIEYDNTITWTDSTDPNTIGYIVYRDDIIFSGTLFGTTSVVDNNRALAGSGKPVTYSVVSYDSNFQLSLPISFTLT